MTSVQQVESSINSILKAQPGVYKQYSCKYVSWDDVQRGTVGGSLSCWGGNITDTRLWEKSGRKLFTVRSDNWNEKLGFVTANGVALVAKDEATQTLKPITLRHFLLNSGQYGSYAGLPRGTDLSDSELDKKVSIRFQTTFLPIQESSPFQRGTLEFCTEAYNYNTRSDQDPRNLIVLCTTQGLAVQQDGQGAKKLYHHEYDASSGTIRRHWLEAERSDHQVGVEQKETEEERLDALQRGKAMASVIGTKSMGTRFNVLLTVQIPLEQKQSQSNLFGSFGSGQSYAFGGGPSPMFCAQSFGGGPKFKKAKSSMAFGSSSRGRGRGGRGRGGSLVRERHRSGRSNAARVSKGSVHDTWPGLAVKEPKRDHHQHITVTVVIYNTVVGGVPSAEDVKAAIDDMEALYRSCDVSGNLADQEFGSLTSELTVKDAMDIEHKITHQPPQIHPFPQPTPFQQPPISVPQPTIGCLSSHPHYKNNPAQGVGIQSPHHLHSLSAEFGPSPTTWYCDGCKTQTAQSQLNYRFRCHPCDFDLCGRCAVPVGFQSGYNTFKHPHALGRADYFPVPWICDGCSKPGISGSPRYRCFGCDFDLCGNCM